MGVKKVLVSTWEDSNDLESERDCVEEISNLFSHGCC